MGFLDYYSKLKNDCQQSLDWSGMIGRVYQGGGGGTGEVKTVKLSEVTVYYQFANGSKNYHEVPEGLKPYIEKEILREMPAIVARAVEAQDAERIRVAGEAQKELNSVLARAEATI